MQQRVSHVLTRLAAMVMVLLVVQRQPCPAGALAKNLAIQKPRGKSTIHSQGLHGDSQWHNRTGVLFQDDFNDGNADGWLEISGEWTVVDQAYFIELSGYDVRGLSVVGDVGWTDYTYEVDVMGTEGVDRIIVFRHIDVDNRYTLNFRGGGYQDIVLYKWANGSGRILQRLPFTNQMNQWYHLRVVLQGDHVQVYVDDQLYIDYTDSGTTLTSGKIGMEGWTGSTGVVGVLFDNVVVTGETSDTIPPAAITDLAASTGTNLGEIDLFWTAPGDDGSSGTAMAYSVRYADSPIDSESTWLAATDVDGEPAPQLAGTSQGMTVTGLTPERSYYFAIKTQDEVPNTSGLSNSPSAMAGGTLPEAQKPIILVHGIQLSSPRGSRCASQPERWSEDAGPDYFSWGEMPRWFNIAGHEVWLAYYATSMSRTPTLEANAKCLEKQIAEVVRDREGLQVIIVAHSMGGLVSRACISLSDCRKNVDSLYTLGSPHAGINSAVLLKLWAIRKVPSAEKVFCKQHPGACQLSRERMLAEFMFNHPNQPNVTYNFLSGAKMTLPWGPIIQPLDGPNDGAVGRHSGVGWDWITGLDAVLGPGPGRYWTEETHTPSLAYPSYFETYGGAFSQSFRCILSLLSGSAPSSDDCVEKTTEALDLARAESSQFGTTVDRSGHISSGQIVSHTLQVDTSDHSLLYLSWITGTLSITLTQPNGQIVTPAYADAHPETVAYTISPGDDMVAPFAVYAFTMTVPGPFTSTIGAGDVGPEGTNYLLFAAMETNRILTVTTSADLYQAGDTAVFTSSLQGPSGGIPGADVRVDLMRMDSITETLTLADLGEGIYKTSYTIPDVPGYLQASFTAAGEDNDTSFDRQVDKLLAIAPHAATLSGTYADRAEDRDGDGFSDTLAVDVGITATDVGTYTVSAALVAGGQTIAHASDYTVLASGTQTVTLQFDGWDIRRSYIDGPYTVTQVHLTDLGVGGIPAQTADDIWVTSAYKWQDFGFESLYLPLVLRGMQ